MTDSGTNANYIKGETHIAQTQIQTVEDQKSAITKGGSKAPTGLLAEFLSSIMIKDYQTAFQYCGQILSYEPNNTTARDFYPLIMEKLEMMSNEEGDHSSSESSDTHSTDSKSSINSLSDIDSQSSDEDLKFSSGDENYLTSDERSAIKDKTDSLDSEYNKKEKQTKSEKAEPKQNRDYTAPAKESSGRTRLGEENSKQLEKRSSAKYLIHPTKTKILKCNGASNEEHTKQSQTNKQTQDDEETPTISQYQSSTSVLLYPTRTITFPKITSESEFSKD